MAVFGNATSGSITPAFFGIIPGVQPVTYYRSYGGVVYKQPLPWREYPHSGGGYTTDVDILLMDAASDPGATLDCVARINDTEYQQALVRSPGTLYYDWVEGDPAGGIVSQSNGGVGGDPDVSVRNLFGLLLMSYDATDYGNTTVRTIHVEQTLTDSANFTGGDNTFEVTGVHPVSAGSYDWTPADQNESCSAFIAKAVVVENTNRVARETMPTWSIPLF
jgi:hypothetical protein